MQITRQILQRERDLAQRRHQEAIAKANAEAGVISALDMLLALEGQPEQPQAPIPAAVQPPAGP